MTVKHNRGDIGLRIGEDTLSTGRIPLRIASSKQLGAAALQHRSAIHIHKRPVDRSGPSYHNAIVALVWIRGTAVSK